MGARLSKYLSKTSPASRQDNLRQDNLRQDNLVWREKAYDMAVVASEQAIKRAEMAEESLIAQAIAHVAALGQFEMQYSFRSSLEALLRNASSVGNHSPGGSLYTQHLLNSVLATPNIECKALSGPALLLYQTIVAFPIFKSYEPSGKIPSFVDSLKPIYSITNDDCHSLPEIMSETGVACGGQSTTRMFKHVFLIASLQKSCIDQSITIDPIFNKVAVVSRDYKKVVAHVSGGVYMPVPVPAEAEAEAAAAEEAEAEVEAAVEAAAEEAAAEEGEAEAAAAAVAAAGPAAL
jgi:hypothetical protein